MIYLTLSNSHPPLASLILLIPALSLASKFLDPNVPLKRPAPSLPLPLTRYPPENICYSTQRTPLAMALQLLETLKEAITAYTGLSPTTFFTVLALGLALYYAVSGLFGRSDHHPRAHHYGEQTQPLPPPVQIGEVTEEELKQYDGTDPEKPLLMAIKGQIYDVSLGR